ncbi:MAG: hypothetical protein ACLQG3_14470 [Terracidiphilus sp.]
MKKILALLLFGLAFLSGSIASAQTANANYPEVWIMPSYAADTGSVNVMTATVTSCPSAYVTGMAIKILPAHANTTTTPTVNLCGLGTKTITKFGTSALAASDLLTTAVAVMVYDGTYFELEDPATLSVSGGTVTDSSGVTTAYELAESTGTAHQVQYNANDLTNSAGIFTTYDGITTAGLGLDVVEGVSDVTAQSTSQSTVNLVASTSAAGHYLVRLYLDQNALCTTGTGSVYATVSWTDATHAHTAQTIPLTLNNTSISAAAGFIDAAIPLWSATSSAITYTTTYTACTSGTGTYDLHAEVERTN